MPIQQHLHRLGLPVRHCRSAAHDASHDSLPCSSCTPSRLSLPGKLSTRSVRQIGATSPNPGSIQRLSRSAIINAALSLESAANICLSSLPMSARFADEVERKFGTIEKFELFLTLHKGAGVFDRGCAGVQKIQDLISLRNEFVHPKSIRLPVQFSSDDSGTKNATVDAGMYEHIRLIKSYRHWNGDSAITAVRAVCEFCDQFFRKWCSWEPDRTAVVLSPAMVADGREVASGIEGEIESFGRAQTLWKVPMDWIKFNLKALAE